MMCYACNSLLSDKELLLNSDEDFIDNKCLCSQCLSISNEYKNAIKKDDN